MKNNHFIFYGIVILLLLITSLASLAIGSADIPITDLIKGLMGTGDQTIQTIVRDLRLPRLIIGLVTGATLGMMGAALQGLLRNPMADPGILGVSASASLGAVIAIYYGIAASITLAVPLLAISGAMITTIILYMLSRRDSSMLTLILVGIGLGSLAAAIMSLFINFAPTAASLRDIVMWLLGSLENRTTTDLILVMPFILVGWLLIIGTGRGLNALALGEDAAISLGVPLNRIRWQIVFGSALAVGATVSVTGAIGFVGLIVPHVVRIIIGNTPGNLILPSAALGALFLTSADLLTRIDVGNGQLRLGVVMSIIGAPLFLAIIYRTRGAMR